jgi:hypothetical protein
MHIWEASSIDKFENVDSDSQATEYGLCDLGIR